MPLIKRRKSTKNLFLKTSQSDHHFFIDREISLTWNLKTGVGGFSSELHRNFADFLRDDVELLDLGGKDRGGAGSVLVLLATDASLSQLLVGPENRKQ